MAQVSARGAATFSDLALQWGVESGVWARNEDIRREQRNQQLVLEKPKPKVIVKTKPRRSKPVYSKRMVIQTWAQARKEKKILEDMLQKGDILPRSMYERLRLLRRVAREKKEAHQEVLLGHKIADKRFAHIHERSDIPRGVKCPTSIKQHKIKVKIPDSAPKWTWRQMRHLKQSEQQRPKFRQQRFGLMLDKICGKAPTSLQSALTEGLVRAKCFSLEKRYPGFFERMRLQCQEQHAEPNMDTPHGSDETMKSKQEGNVVIQTMVEPSVAPAALPRTLGFLGESSATESQTFSQITERWLKHSQQIVWSTTDEFGKNLMTLNLPFDILNNNLTSPNVLPFRIHKYVRSGMKIQIVINSNKFQVGQLQVSWMYNSHINKDDVDYDSVYSASQRKHIIINAGSSNSGILEVPYWALTSAMNLKTNSDEKDQGTTALVMGQLKVKVLAPLQVPTTGTSFQRAYADIYIAFDNPEFRALCDQNLGSPFSSAEPNMDIPQLVNTAESVLKLTKPVFNLDKPTYPQVANQVQPMASHSFGCVKGQNESIRPLRADPLAQTPGLVTKDGMDSTFKDLFTRWSLVKKFSWKADDVMGTKLFTFDSSPIWAKSQYATNLVNSNTYYYTPIIANVASMFAYWRGDLEIRLDVVASQFHSGALMIATIPGGEGTESIETAKNSANLTYILTDNHQIVYRVPYYGNVPFWKTKHNLDRSRDVFPPSRTIIYVLNPLVPMQSVTSEIQINVYIRAADNFEVALLRTPSLALPFNKDIKIPTGTQAWVDPSWDAMFTSGSRWTNNRLCFFYNETTDYFTQFLNLKSKTVYIIPTDTTKLTINGEELYFRVQYYSDSTTLANVTHFVKCEQYPWYPVVACFSTLAKAQAYAANPTQAVLDTNGIAEIKQGPWAQVTTQASGTRIWRNITGDELTKVPFSQVAARSAIAEPNFEDEYVLVAEPNMDEMKSVNEAVVSLDKPASETGFGRKVFGENINSLVEACKRWYSLGYGIVVQNSVDAHDCLSDAPCVLSLSTHPIKNFVSQSSGNRDNRLRDGFISLVSSAFAGYRGSMRYRIIVSGQDIQHLAFSVVHKYDKRVSPSAPSVRTGIQNNREAPDWFDTAYASEVQCTYVNSVLEFEIPFYNRGEYNSLYRVNADAINILDNYQMCGEVRVYVTGRKANSSLGFDVFYSVGDDFAFSNFQGFPYMYFLDDLPAEPNGPLLSCIKDDYKLLTGEVYCPCEEIEMQEFAEPNMDYVKSFFTTPKKLGDLCDVVKNNVGVVGHKVVDSLTSVTSSISSIAVQTYDKFKIPSFSSMIASCGGFAHTLITQLLHILANPYSKLTIAIALFSVLCSVMSDKICSLFEEIKKAFKACWQWLFGKNKPNQAEETVAEPNMDDSDHQATFLSLLWSIVATITGFIGKAPKSMGQFVTGLFVKSSDTFRTHVFGVRFFKDFLECLKRMWSWINVTLGMEKPLYKLTGNDKFLQEWALSAAVLLAPENDQRIITSKEWVGKLFEVQIIGRLIKQAAINTSSHITRDLFNMICDTQKRLTDKVDILTRKKCYIPIRQEPFIIWFVGEPGVGKSHIAQIIMRKLAADYKLNPDIFSLVAGQKYYDLLQTQKFILLDDFLNWTGDSAEEVFAQYLQMSGSNMLSLPRAMAQDKAVLDNFEFLFVTSNQMWFDTMCGIRCPEAYNRRRHLTIKMKPSKEFSKGFASEKTAAAAYRKLPDKEKSSYNNLVFEIFEQDEVNSKYTVKGFDRLYEYIKMASDAQRDQAAVKYAEAVKQHMSALEKASESATSFNDFFDKIKSLVEDAKIEGLDVGIKESGKKSVDWIADRLRARYSIYEEVRSNLTEAETLTKQTKELVESAKPSTSKAEPNMQVVESTDEDVVLKCDDLNDGIDGLVDRMQKVSEEFDKDLERFVPPINGIYEVARLPKLCAEVNSKVRGLVNVFNESTTCCPHRKLDFSSAYYYKFSEKTRDLIKCTYKVNPSPEGIFVNPRGGAFGYETNVSEAYACFDTICTLDDGSPDLFCSWLDTSQKRKDLSIFWNSLVGLLKYKVPSWIDFVNLTEDQKLTIMPTALFLHVKDIYTRDEPFLMKLKKQHIGSILFTIKNGFMADKLVVDGVNHGIYPLEREIQNGVRDGESKVISRSKGILFDDVSVYCNGSVRKETQPSTLCKLLIIIGLVIAALSGLIMFVDLILCFLEYWGVFSLWEWNKGSPCENMSTSGDFKVTKQASKATVKAIQMLKSQDNGGTEPSDGRLKRVMSNIFFMTAVVDTDDKLTYTKVRCLGVYGYKAIVLSHYIEYFSMLKSKYGDKCKFKLFRMDSKTATDLDFDKMEFDYPSSGGYCIMTFPKGGFQFKDIRKYIPNERQATYPSKADLVEVNPEETFIHSLDIRLTFRKQVVQADPETGISSWEINQKLEYDKCGKGLCGAFIFAGDLDKPLLGIHTAGLGAAGVGFSELLLAETFGTETRDVVDFVTPNMEVNPELYQPSGPHVAVGHLPPDMGVIVPSKTRICPSKAFGLFETRTEPAPLHPSDPRLPPDSSPLELGVEKRCDLVKGFPNKFVQIAVEDVKNMILSKCKPVRAKVDELSVAQAVEGIKGIRGMEPLELKTSEGYPWVKMRPKGFSDKRWLFDMDDQGAYPKCNGVSKDLQDVLDLKRDMRVRRVVPATYFTACLKDARILKEKCSIPGKTRLFEMSPVDMTIAQRQCFLDFYAAYMNNRRECEHTIGINVNGPEWSLLAEDLYSFSPYILGGDYSAYGPRLPLEILHYAWDIKTAWMMRHYSGNGDREPFFNNIMTMKYECLNSLLVVGRYVMRALGGMHSGNVATVILNSLCNSIMVRIAYLGIMDKENRKYSNMTHFHKFVKMFSNGDDLIVSVKEEIINYFNNVSIAEFFKEFGIKYTCSKKDVEILPFESLFEVSYLKCNFKPHPERRYQWLAALDRVSIEDCPQWIWDKDIDPWEATIQNCDQAVRLAYGQGREYFDLFRTKVQNFLNENFKYVQLPTWDELDHLVWDEGETICYF